VEGCRIKSHVGDLGDGLDKVVEGVHVRMLIAPEKFNARLAEKKVRAAL